MTRPNAWLRLAAISFLAVIACGGASACGDDAASDGSEARATVAANRDSEERRVRELAAEHEQSREERSIARKAKRLQADLAAGDYAAVCDQLLASTAAALAPGGGTCADGLEAASSSASGPPPLVAWVRLRGGWGNVMALEADGNISLSPIIREGSRWRFSSLGITGIELP